MTIGPDIKEVLSEVGTAFTIKRDSGDITGEFLDFSPNTQVTKPFIREFFLEVMLSYDTDTVPGDIVELDVPAVPYMVMNLTPDMFENEVVKNDGIIYKCNVSGELLRFSGEADWSDTTYRKLEHLQLVRADCYAVLSSPVHGGELETDEPIGYLDMERQELYIPSSVGIQEMDRYQPVSGEYYMVIAVKKRRYPNVDMALLSEDTR
jgi:hypothetical protein